VPETALIRRINSRVNHGVLPNEDYRQLVRELLAHRTLSQRAGSPRLTLPPDVRAWACDLSEQWIEELAGRGYDVVGTLDDLRPPGADPAAEFADPDAPDEHAVADAALEAVVTLLGEAARLEHEARAARAERDAATDELERNRSLWFRAKRRAVLEADHNRLAAVGLAAYRRARGRDSAATS
jgi:hypothetical protein